MAMWYSVQSKYLQEVNLAWKRKNDGREQEVSEKLGLSLRLVIDNLFLKGEPVNRVNFIEICQFLGMNWQEIAGLEELEIQIRPSPAEPNAEEAILLRRPTGGVDDVDQAINELVGTLCEMLRRITRKAGDLIRADRTSIFLLDHQTKVLGTIIADDGNGGCLLIDIPANRGIASLAANSLQVINIPFDVYDDPRSEEAKRTDQRTGYRTYTMLAWPLLNKQKDLVAVVQLINKLKSSDNPEDDLSKRIDKKGFTPEDEEKFAKFAPSILKILEKCQLCYELAQKLKKASGIKQGGSLIQNAALIAELKRQEQQLRKNLNKIQIPQKPDSPRAGVVYSSQTHLKMHREQER
ncbi:GAF domain-containing protein [Allocoleopsis franciscana PCC 7113]|uniref:GAF domain-containing protein n=2 Tax=Allocoleopsis TaxID=2886347 RepID=K9WLF9_9CYAN|nr:GAF domain-containing protein [Allocoleopsis franciscana PCC 7113]